jgi:hypothetical protein
MQMQNYFFIFFIGFWLDCQIAKMLQAPNKF